MGQRKIHRLGFHSHPHVCGFLPPSVVMGTRRGCEHAADRKRNKYATLPASREFVPIAVETLGPINREGREFLLELGRHGAGVSGDPRETVFLFQRPALTPSLIVPSLIPSQRTPRTRKSLLDYITVI